MSRPLPPEKIARYARVIPAMMLAAGVVFSGLIFYLLGFSGPHHSIAEGGIISVGLLVADCLAAWVYRRSMMATARRAAQQGANSPAL